MLQNAGLDGQEALKSEEINRLFTLKRCFYNSLTHICYQLAHSQNCNYLFIRFHIQNLLKVIFHVTFLSNPHSLPT